MCFGFVSIYIGAGLKSNIMLHYPPKILMAFGETFDEEDGKFLEWLLKNGYPELAALSSGIKGSKEALDWLMKNDFPQFVALDGAIDNKAEAINWLRRYEFEFLIVFADAIHGKETALAWFKNKGLDIFVHLANKIKSYGDRQSFDYHKLHF